MLYYFLFFSESFLIEEFKFPVPPTKTSRQEKGKFSPEGMYMYIVCGIITLNSLEFVVAGFHGMCGYLNKNEIWKSFLTETKDQRIHEITSQQRSKKFTIHKF